jgi:hypothetical protein
VTQPVFLPKARGRAEAQSEGPRAPSGTQRLSARMVLAALVASVIHLKPTLAGYVFLVAVRT